MKLFEFLHDQDETAKRSLPFHIEEIDRLPIIPIPKPLPFSPKVTVELKGPTEWSQRMSNTYFTDGSSTIEGTEIKYKVTAYRPGDGMTITE